MIAGALIAALIDAGEAVLDGMKKSNSWPTFLASPDFAALHGQLDSVIASMQGSDLRVAISDIQGKKDALLGGRDVGALPQADLDAYYALQHVSRALTIKELTDANTPRSDFARLLVDSLLPVLKKAAPIVLAILV